MAHAIAIFLLSILSYSSEAFLRKNNWSVCDGGNKCLTFNRFTHFLSCSCCEGYFMDYDGICKLQPRFTNCPNTTIEVNVSRYDNRATLRLYLKAEDWNGNSLSVTYSRTLFRHCKCNDTREEVTARSAYDENAKFATCTFTVLVKDKYPPVIKDCPRDIYTSDKRLVRWSMPRIKDNVGIWRATAPLQKNNTIFQPGYYTMSYNATDFDGNTAKCTFRAFIYNSQTYGKGPDTQVVISGTVIAALMLLLVIMSLAMVRIFKKRRQLRNRSRRTIAYYGSRLARGGSGTDDQNGSVYVISREPPSYAELFADKPPDYKDVSYLPSYEHFQRMVRESSLGKNQGEDVGHDNLAYAGDIEVIQGHAQTESNGDHVIDSGVSDENENVENSRQTTI